MGNKDSVFVGITAGERGQRAVERLREVFGAEELPSGFDTLSFSENGMYDVYMNLNRQLGDGKVERKSKLLIAVAIASLTGSAEAVEFFAKSAIAAGRTAAEALEAVSAASTCSAYNAYYKFRDLIGAEDLPTYEAFKANFNANTFVKPLLSVY